MKQIVRHGIIKALASLPLRQLTEWSGVRVLPVFYHTVFDQPPPYFAKLYAVKSPREFESDLDDLLVNFSPISIFDLLDSETDDDLPQRSLFLSFDDGYRELFDIIAPILLRKGVPATFFLCSSLIDNTAWFFEDQIGLLRHHLDQKKSTATRQAADAILEGQTLESLLQRRVPPTAVLDQLADCLGFDWNEELASHAPYLTSAKVHDLKNKGFGIGAHGIDHTVFEIMKPSDQIRQISESCNGIASKFDLNYRVFAFPYGEFGVSRDVIQQVRSQRLADRLYGTRGLVTDEFHPFLRQRLWCENHDGSLQAHLRSNFAEKQIRRVRQRDIVRRHG